MGVLTVGNEGDEEVSQHSSYVQKHQIGRGNWVTKARPRSIPGIHIPVNKKNDIPMGSVLWARADAAVARRTNREDPIMAEYVWVWVNRYR